MSDRVERLPVAERSEILALARRIRAALPDGASRARELVCELERRLEAPVQADASEAEGA